MQGLKNTKIFDFFRGSPHINFVTLRSKPEEEMSEKEELRAIIDPLVEFCGTNFKKKIRFLIRDPNHEEKEIEYELK